MSKNASLLAVLCSLALVGCADTAEPPTPTGDALVVDAPPATTRVAGFTYDPETYFWTYAMCGGPGCPIPPYLSPGIPMFDQALLTGGDIAAFDVVAGAPSATAEAPADGQGLFDIEGVESRQDPPFFLIASGGSLVDLGGAAPFPPPPPGNYLPSFTLRPIVTQSPACFAQQALQISDVGVLQAVANRMTADGTPTTVDDLLTPDLHAGVAVWFLLEPGEVSTVAPAQGTTVTATSGPDPVGQVFNIDWAPPGALPPEAEQSDRGFYVTPDATSPVGIVVVVLDPLTGPPSPVTFTAVDPTTDGAARRPWNFPPLDLMLAPGMVSIAPLQLMEAPDPNAQAGLGGSSGGGAPTWLCLPNF